VIVLGKRLSTERWRRKYPFLIFFIIAFYLIFKILSYKRRVLCEFLILMARYRDNSSVRLAAFGDAIYNIHHRSPQFSQNNAWLLCDKRSSRIKITRGDWCQIAAIDMMWRYDYIYNVKRSYISYISISYNYNLTRTRVKYPRNYSFYWIARCNLSKIYITLAVRSFELETRSIYNRILDFRSPFGLRLLRSLVRNSFR